MEVSQTDCRLYEAILKEELLTALGCTEPIAIAFAAAKAREVLRAVPEEMTVECSGNLIKNARAVVVPMTVDLRGIEAAAVLGAVGGDPAKELEVLTSVTEEDLARTKELLAQNVCRVRLLETPAKLHIIVRCAKGGDNVMVEILHEHNHIVHIEKNGAVVYDIPHSPEDVGEGGTDRSCLTLEKIVAFAQTADLSNVARVLDKQIACNSAIAAEGLSARWGESVGQTLLEVYGESVGVRARAAAAAGSDARMNGCEMPVVINSGSGNQGITVSVPVIEYARELGCSRDQLYRALLVSNLVAIMQKYKMGRLSAFCGAVSAGTAAACGIAFLQGAGAELIGMIITNSLGNIGGVVCDGAKSSCAAKISSSIEAGLMGYEMAKRGRVFRPGEGLVKENCAGTIDSFCRMAKDGMDATDKEILRIMVEG
ncbi:L-serine ammonia-lyase, iron-sulfur-dependent, subunit alpha [Pseudoflavonifractor phocaeensis]|uniref:L-cysteine desulfidase family protein n=1 Tax=Pseudoflavonifractor phocaeensis TaxID=1870988 RepID=UPI00313F09F5